MIRYLALFVLTFLVYAQGISTSSYGGDSGDIILSAWFGGIAHAPGYPLNAIIGWLFTHLPYQATVAYKANLMAAFFMAITVAILFLTVRKLIRNTLIAVAASLIFAFNPLVWLYAHLIEVFQLNLVLVAASIYSLICWRESILVKKVKVKFLYLSFLFWGLAVFHHQTSLLIAPAYFYLIIKTKNVFRLRSTVFKLAFSFCLGFIPNIYMIFASFKDVPTNWVTIRTVNDFAGLILRVDYGTFVASGIFLSTDLKARFLEIFYYLILLKSDFQIIPSVLILCGASYTFFKEKTIFWAIFLAIFFTGPFFVFYAAFPIANDFYQGLWERFVLLSYFFLTFYIAYGFKIVHIFFKKYLMPMISHEKVHGLLMFCLLALFLTVPLYMFNTNLNKVNMAKFVLGDSLGHDILFSADDNAIVFLLGDSITFNTEYVYYTSLSDDHVRSLKLIRGGSLSDLDYRNRVAKTYPILKFPQAYYENVKKEGLYFIKLLVEENKGSFPVYIIELPPHIDSYRWTNVGLLKKLVLEKDYTAELVAAENKNKFGAFRYKEFTNDTVYEQFIVANLKNIYYRAFIGVSDELIGLKELEEAKRYLSLALTLDSERKEAYLKLGSILSEDGSCNESLANYKKGQALDKKDWRILVAISSLYKNCFKDDNLTKSYLDQANYLRSSLEDKPLKSF